MEFAEWVVSGLDRLRLGQLSGGDGFYQAIATGVGDDPALSTFMSSGDPAARAELVQAIARAVTVNPEFEQRLRDAATPAVAAQQSETASAAKPSFFKTTKGKLALVATAVVVIGGGIGLGVGLSGSGDDGFTRAMKGTWNCGREGTLVIGDGTFNAGSFKGTWKKNGGKAIITMDAAPNTYLEVTDLPSGPGDFEVTMKGHGEDVESDPSSNVTGTVSKHSLTVAIPVQLLTTTRTFRSSCTK